MLCLSSSHWITNNVHINPPSGFSGAMFNLLCMSISRGLNPFMLQHCKISLNLPLNTTNTWYSHYRLFFPCQEIAIRGALMNQPGRTPSNALWDIYNDSFRNDAFKLSAASFIKGAKSQEVHTQGAYEDNRVTFIAIWIPQTYNSILYSLCLWNKCIYQGPSKRFIVCCRWSPDTFSRFPPFCNPTIE